MNNGRGSGLADDNSQVPKASVLMPVHNSAPFLREATESILDQTCGDFEFIIVDDGSTDESPAILAECAKKDKRIRIITNQANMGIVYSLNRGLAECRGQYIVRMDSDDVSLHNRIEKQTSVMDAKPDVVAMGAAVSYIDAAGKNLGVIRRSAVPKTMLGGNKILHPTAIIRRHSLVQSSLKYREEYRYAEDYYLWLELSLVGKLHAIDDVVLKYRINNQATRVQQLKSVLWATVKVKKDAMWKLKLRPRVMDLIIMALEICMMAMPSKLILWLYFKKMFGWKSVSIFLKPIGPPGG
jgi:glycosyltransferase involved in cell wall biosynthesis